MNKDDILTNLQVDYTANGKHYTMSCEFSNFSNAQVNVPDGFFAAAQLQT